MDVGPSSWIFVPTVIQQIPKPIIEASASNDWVRRTRRAFAKIRLDNGLCCVLDMSIRLLVSQQLDETEGHEVWCIEWTKF